MIYQRLAQLIKPGGAIIEIGAHIGTDTVRLYRLLEPARYYAIEPDPRNIKRLEALGLPVRIIQTAVSNRDGRAPFWYSGGQTRKGREHTDSNSLLEPVKQPDWVTFERGTVVTSTLDTLFPGPAPFDLIWMDVQGAELLVIEGARETLKKTDYLYTECQEGRYMGQPGLKGILAALPGWEAVLKNGDNVLLRNKKGEQG
jgi:FkbM family methyltransferase